MKTDDPTGGVQVIAASRLRLFASIFLDCAFLALWLAISRFFDKVVAALGGKGELDWVIAKCLFAASTLALILLFIYWDLRTAVAIFRVDFHRKSTQLAALEGPSAAEGAEP